MMLAGWCCLQLLLDLLYCSCTTTTQSLSGGGSGCVPTNYQVHSQLMLGLSCSVTIWMNFNEVTAFNNDMGNNWK